MKQPDDTSKHELIIDKNLRVILITVLAIYLLSGTVITILWYNDKQHFGTLGDSFGLLNTLFSGLAFGGVLYTIHLQRVELYETRQEFIKHSRIFNKQRFDDSFFRILDLFEISRNKLNKMDGSFFADLSPRLFNQRYSDVTILTKRYKTILQQDYTNQMDYFAIYIESLLSLLRFVASNNELSKVEVYEYLKYVFNPMSDMEKDIVLIELYYMRKEQTLIDKLAIGGFTSTFFDELFL